mgnify:CR=1 FL=1|tara:strand:- start:84 stop:1430 length:1347 start_codon:yes stop_codon:yes gene_type:complete
MSGTVAAHAAYNYTGTQNLAVTDRLVDPATGAALSDYMSVFYNKNDITQQLLYGSCLVEVSSTGGSGTNSIGTANTQIFDITNDIDCLGDLILKVSLQAGGSNTALAGQKITNLISRVEIQIGTQIWQTFEHSDIQALAATELSKGSYDDYSFQTTGGVDSLGLFSDLVPGGSASVLANSKVSAFIPLKLFTKTLAPRLENFAEQSESGYLMAAAPSQSVRVKVYTNASSGITGFTTVELSLFAFTHVMCSAERDQINAESSVAVGGTIVGLPKRIKMTQNQTKFSDDNAQTVTLDLDHFSLYTSHLIISIGGDLTGVLENRLREAKAELLLNSTTYSGKLPLGLLKLTGNSIGLNTHEYRASTNTAGDHAAGDDIGIQHTYVFPLASRAYGGSSVPLNRFDNIRLKITDLGGASPGAAVNAGTTFNVTCVGETTALYKNGAASLAMY